MGAEQRPQLVTAQHPPAVGVEDRRRAPVGVGVVRDHHVGPDLRATARAASIAPASSGFGKLTVGKSGSGFACVATVVRLGEARGSEDATDRVVADTVERGVHDRQATRGVRRDQRGHPVHVGVLHLVTEGLPAVVDEGQVANRCHGGDVGRDLGVGRRHDLAAVAEVDLVPVVLRRVVARRDHDARVGAEVPDRERQHRRRQRPRQDRGATPGPHHDGRGVAREDVGVVPGVEPPTTIGSGIPPSV